MWRTMLWGKIHRARVTAADLHYVGSITIDMALVEAAGMRAYERVQVVDIDNGARLETYIMPGAPNSGVVQLNGAAAHLVHVGDRVIVMSYVIASDEESRDWRPRIVIVDDENRIVEVRNGQAATALGGDC